jgi:hypothetical protein
MGGEVRREVALAAVFLRAGTAPFPALLFSFPARGLADRLRLALALGVRAPAAFRALAGFRLPPLLAFAARAAVPVRLVDAFLSPFLLPLFFAIAGVSPPVSPLDAPLSWLTNRP